MATMSQRIPSHFIRELLNRIDIIDLVDARVPLRKAGANYKACCPFHDEKTPSFTVSAQKQIFHCFGCQQSGDAIAFLQQYEHYTFVEAVEALAHLAGLTIPQEKNHASQPRAPQATVDGYALLEKAGKFYTHQLKNHPEAQAARDYLQQRGLSASTIERYELGYAPSQWDSLCSTLGNSPDAINTLQRTGLIIEKSSQRRYDRFRHRIMFPIRNAQGRLVAFGGRVLDNSEPKYLNSPETPYFHKGSDVYGLQQAAPKGKTPPHLLMVEGYMDVIALSEGGIHCAVATLGTATTRKHVERLFRITSRLIFCFDGDKAGTQAAWRALENALPTLQDHREIAFILLPNGEDPDSYIRQQGKAAMEQCIAKAIPFSTFFFQQIQTLCPHNTLEGRAHLMQKALPLLQQIPGRALQRLMLEQLATLTQMPVATMEQLYATKKLTKAPIPLKQPKIHPSHLTHAITLLLHTPAFSAHVTERHIFEADALPGYGLFNQLLIQCDAHPNASTASLIAPWLDTKIGKRFLALAAKDLPIPQEGQEAEFKDAIKRLKQLAMEQTLQKLLEKAQKPGELTKKEKTDLQQLIVSTKHLSEH